MPTVSAVGKPILFFSTHNADRGWRLKEKLVAIIESYLQPIPEPYTFSNAHLPDVIGSMEEVDVAFAEVGDPTAAFSFVEVRDRESNVGRGYIEELIGKRKALGLTECTVVSTRGFSRDATALAEHEGIKARRLLPSTLADEPWFKPDAVSIDQLVVRIERSAVVLSDSGRVLTPESEGDTAPVLAPTGQEGDYRAIPVGRVFQVDFLGNPERRTQLMQRVPMDGKLHPANYSITYQQPRLAVEREGRLLPVHGVAFHTRVGLVEIRAPIAEAHRYFDAASEQLLAQALLAPFELDGQRRYVCLVRYSPQGGKCVIGGALFG